MRQSSAPKSPRVGIVTLGCDKNTVDNEYLAGLLAARGIEVCAADAPAASSASRDGLDAVVITTCGFTARAREENIARIVEWAEQKKAAARPLKLYLAGCLSQRFAAELRESIPEIDGLVGVGQWTKLARMIAAGRPEIFYPRPDRAAVLVALKQDLPRSPLDSRPYAYLKISDGCNHKCAFCAIPLMKGRLSSVPRDIVLGEARRLIARGAREINVVSQDTADYGRDRHGRELRIHSLLHEILALEGDFRVRLLYLYPAGVTDELIELLAGHPKLCKYIDMPLQHLDPGVLRRMRRPHRAVHVEGLIAKLRERVPGIRMRTTFIVGFPGESEAAFEQLLAGVERIGFDWLGAFQFSVEEGTPAATLPGQLPPQVKAERYDRLMRLQTKIAADKSRGRIGSECDVLIEGAAEEPQNWYVGRSEFEAPEVDGMIFVESPQPLRIGQTVRVRVVDAATYDLFARAL